MHYVDSEHTKNYVVTYQELVFIFVAFCVILIVLYPKDLLKEQILSEKSNYDLSMLYLKTLLEHDPKNESLMLILAEQSLRTGKKDLSLRLLELLLNSESQEYRNKATLLSYELKKDDYYYIQDESLQSVQKEVLRKLFLNIVNKEMYSEESIEQWYNESIFLQEDAAMYLFVKKKLLKEESNVALLEIAYYLSVKLHKPEESWQYVSLLSKYDKEKKDKWVLDGYYMLINNKLFDKALELLYAHVDDSPEWKNRLANFYLMRQQYIKASDMYLEMFAMAQEYTMKKQYFFQAMRALQAGNEMERIVALAKKYELNYIKDIEIRKFLLKIYLATGNLDQAAVLSKKILQREIKK
ncbi:MAG: hypothetical protein IBX44_03675 [Sulfurospirillum sp.]|nr:hypothetical protein [Sulfurospirillum sp.]